MVMTVDNQLREIREREGISPAELARASDISLETVLRAEYPELRIRRASAAKIVGGLNRLLAGVDKSEGAYSLADVFPGEAWADVPDRAASAVDAWASTWADHALQALGRHLEGYGVPVDHAADAVERFWVYYSYIVLPAVGKRIPVGISSKGGERVKACFYLPGLSTKRSDAEDRRRLPVEHDLVGDFEREVSAPLSAWLEMNLRVVSPRWGEADHLEGFLKRYAAMVRIDYLGIFQDDLASELTTVIDRRDVRRWLSTPNMLFDGQRPRESLANPIDMRLRNIILRAKLGLPAA